MFTKRIIPCLDVNNGRVVKGVNFVRFEEMPEIRWRLQKLMMQAGADEAGFSGYHSIL